MYFLLVKIQQDSQLSRRYRAEECYNYRQKWLTGTGGRYFTDVYLQPLWYNQPENLSNSAKKSKIRVITAFKVIQGHRGRYQSKACIQLPISD